MDDDDDGEGTLEETLTKALRMARAGVGDCDVMVDGTVPEQEIRDLCKKLRMTCQRRGRMWQIITVQ